MIDRGLIVDDEEVAKHYIEKIGYYRLSGYALPFQQGGSNADRHLFGDSITFDMILGRYIFDRKLRLLLMDSIERVEVSIRSALSNSIAQKHTPHWYTNAALFDPSYDHPGLIRELKRQIGHNANTPDRIDRQDIFIRHYYETYDDPELPPSWMVFESISFGVISKLFEGLYKSETTDICLGFKVNHDVLSSWLHTISYIRNLCAHHSRLWNKTLTIKPKIAKRHKEKFNGNSKIYAALVVIQIMLEEVAPDNTWAERLCALIDEHPEVPINNMGFPNKWREREFWGLNASSV